MATVYCINPLALMSLPKEGTRPEPIPPIETMVSVTLTSGYVVSYAPNEVFSSYAEAEQALADLKRKKILAALDKTIALCLQLRSPHHGK